MLLPKLLLLLNGGRVAPPDPCLEYPNYISFADYTVFVELTELALIRLANQSLLIFLSGCHCFAERVIVANYLNAPILLHVVGNLNHVFTYDLDNFEVAVVSVAVSH